MLTDSHCHLSKKYYNDIEKIINNAKINGIGRLINNGTENETNREVIELAKKFENVYACIGIHPEEVQNSNLSDLKFIEENIDKVIAIGEIGLDYYYCSETKEKQLEFFKLQMALAEKYHKPVVIHARNASEDVIRIIKEYPIVKGVIHCFTDNLDVANTYISLGYLLGIGGILTFKNSELKKVVEKIPLEKIILETDSPYLAPVPVRGTINEPSNIKYIASELCEIKKISLEELTNQTEKNISELFDI